MNPSLSEDESQPEAGEVSAPEESSQKRKGKENLMEEPKKKKKKKLSGPLPKASGGLKVGGHDNPPPSTPC